MQRWHRYRVLESFLILFKVLLQHAIVKLLIKLSREISLSWLLTEQQSCLFIEVLLVKQNVGRRLHIRMLRVVLLHLLAAVNSRVGIVD